MLKRERGGGMEAGREGGRERERGRERLAQADVVCSGIFFFWLLATNCWNSEDRETFCGVCIHTGCWGRGGAREREKERGGEERKHYCSPSCTRARGRGVVWSDRDDSPI